MGSKKPQTPLRNIKMAPNNGAIKIFFVPQNIQMLVQNSFQQNDPSFPLSGVPFQNIMSLKCKSLHAF